LVSLFVPGLVSVDVAAGLAFVSVFWSVLCEKAGAESRRPAVANPINSRFMCVPRVLAPADKRLRPIAVPRKNLNVYSGVKL
jgi:hypothetical protein